MAPETVEEMAKRLGFEIDDDDKTSTIVVLGPKGVGYQPPPPLPPESRPPRPKI